MINIVSGDPREPAVRRLLEASHALMATLFPADANHLLPVDALLGPGILFKVAKRGEVTVGCAALALCDGYGEIKSMFVDESARGAGVADALMDALEAEAVAHSLSVLRLETGSKLVAAQKVYARHGFVERGPFGTYKPGPFNVFMEKRLDLAP